jgi:hypothetical protein
LDIIFNGCFIYTESRKAFRLAEETSNRLPAREAFFHLSLPSARDAISLAQRDWLLIHGSRIPVDHGLIVAGGNIRTPRIA